MQPYYERDGIALYLADCRAILPTLPGASIDLIVTDPPYFRVKAERWDRQWDTAAGFLGWLRGLAAEWQRVLKPNGSLYVFASPAMAWGVEGVMRERFNVLNSIRWVKDAGRHQKAEKEALRSFLSPWEAVIFAEQHGDAYEDSSQSLHHAVYAPIGRRITEVRERVGLKGTDVDIGLGNVRRKNPDRGTELCRRWEEGACLPTPKQYMALLRLCGDSRDDAALRQEYEALRQEYEALRQEYEALRQEYEALRQEYEALRQEYEALRQEYEALRRPFRLHDRAEWSDVWQFQPVPAMYAKHPCAKPVALLEHIIAASSRPGALVLDCFLGSGATAVAARNLGRQCIGVDTSERYLGWAIGKLAQQRLPWEVSA